MYSMDGNVIIISGNSNCQEQDVTTVSIRSIACSKLVPVALDFVAQFLDVSESTAGVTLLLVGVVAVSGHVSGFTTVIAALLTLLLWLLTVPGDVTTPVTVITR